MKRDSIRNGLLCLGLAIGFSMQAMALPIKPNQGEGKYKFCQRMYDSCMTGVFGVPGSQSYNTGRARCYSKWTNCRKTSTWTVSAAAGSRLESYGDEYAAQLDAEDCKL